MENNDSRKPPLLSVGLPVYNGERFLQFTLDSILGQSFRDFELIIFDNASTDNTMRICQEYAAHDQRIRYFRNIENIGAAENFNCAFRKSRGVYFKWAAADDLLSPDFFSLCIHYLEQHPETILCYSRADRISSSGEVDGVYDFPMRVNNPSPHVRFGDLILINHFCIAVFGVLRREVLVKSPLIGKYVGSDRVLLADLSLRGPFYEIPDFLFHRRDHPQTSGRAFNKYQRLSWFDPSRKKHLNLIYWKVGQEYFRSIINSSTPYQEKARCLILLCKWFSRRRTTLFYDIKTAIYQIFPPLRMVVEAVKKSQQGKMKSRGEL